MSYTKGLRIHKGAPWIIDDENGSIVGCFETSGRSVAEDTANALMFVASGPMLEALEGMACGTCRNRIGCTDDPLPGEFGGYDWRSCPDCKAARAAIALAKGEKP